MAKEGVAAHAEERACRECGCTEISACVDEHDTACHWVEWDLCSMCAPSEASPRVSVSTQRLIPRTNLPAVYVYCGDPRCWVCQERGLVPEGEAVVER